MRKLVLLLAVPTLFPFALRAQEAKVNTQFPAEAVRRILTWHFKSPKVSKVIYIYEVGVTKDMLPKIRNIEFRLVSKENSPKNVYRLRDWEEEGRDRGIGFLYGDIECGSSGFLWRYRIRDNRVRLWNTGSGIGTGCGAAGTVGSGGSDHSRPLL